jgi:hypothetical protein
MACTLTGSFEGDAAYFAEQKLKETQAQVLELTQALCAVMRAVEGHPGVEVPDAAKAWWQKHRDQDELAKLRELVGLYAPALDRADGDDATDFDARNRIDELRRELKLDGDG